MVSEVSRHIAMNVLDDFRYFFEDITVRAIDIRHLIQILTFVSQLLCGCRRPFHVGCVTHDHYFLHHYLKLQVVPLIAFHAPIISLIGSCDSFHINNNLSSFSTINSSHYRYISWSHMSGNPLLHNFAGLSSTLYTFVTIRLSLVTKSNLLHSAMTCSLNGIK